MPAGKPITSEYGVAREMVTGLPTAKGELAAGGYTWHAEKVDLAVRELDKAAARLRDKLPVLDRLDPKEAARARELIAAAELRANEMRPFVEMWKERHITHPKMWKIDGDKIVPTQTMPADPSRGGLPARLPNKIPGEPP